MYSRYSLFVSSIYLSVVYTVFLFLIDDIYISGYLSQKGIVKKVIKFDMNNLDLKGRLLDVNSNNRQINPLKNINTSQKNRKWSIDVIKYYEEFIVKKQ